MEYQIAQVNIGRILAPMESDIMQEFQVNLEPINKLAESSEGFIWRLKDESDNATSIPVTEDKFLIVNLSVWRSIEDLFAFTYRTAHTEFLSRRGEWFHRLKDMHMAMWWVPAGQFPTVGEAMQRIEYIRVHGSTPFAFLFKKRFTVEEALAYE